MINIIYNMSSFLLFSFICIVFIGLALIAIKLVHYCLPARVRHQENPALISVSSTISIIYAILIGFTVLYELDNYDNALKAENEEAKIMFSIFRLARGLPQPYSATIRSLIVSYAQQVIDAEWPRMTEGHKISPVGVSIIGSISKQVRSFKIQPDSSELVPNTLNAISLNTNALFDFHQERVNNIHSALSANLWFVLGLGTFLTLGINCLLGIELRLHLVCIIAIALMLSAVSYLLITLDRPYRGDFSVHPNTFKATLEYLK